MEIIGQRHRNNQQKACGFELGKPESGSQNLLISGKYLRVNGVVIAARLVRAADTKDELMNYGHTQESSGKRRRPQ